MKYWNYDDKEYAPEPTALAPTALAQDPIQYVWLVLSILYATTYIYVNVDNYINKNKHKLEVYNTDNRFALITDQIRDLRRQTTNSLRDSDSIIESLSRNQNQLTDRYEDLSLEQTQRTQSWVGVGTINDVIVTVDISRTAETTSAENAHWLSSEFSAGRDDRLFYKPTQYWTFSVGQNGEQMPAEPCAKKEYKKSDWNSVTKVKITIDFPQNVLQGKRFSQALIDYLPIHIPDRHPPLVDTADGGDTTLRMADVCVAILIRMVNEDKLVWNKTTTTSK